MATDPFTIFNDLNGWSQ